MPNPILPRRSFTPNAVPIVSTDISAPGELLINWADGKAFTKDSAGNLITLTLGGSGSGEDTLLRSLFVPPAPTSVTASSGNAQAVVSWTAPSVLSQTPITDYVVQYSTNGTAWTTFSDGTSTATTATVTGLTNGTAYQFRVAAVNGVGTGAYSTASSAVTPASGDPLFGSVALLMHSDSAITDSSAYGRTLTASGASVSTATKKYGAGSLSVAGNGQYVSVPGSTAFDMSGDFVIEFWINLANASSQQWFIGGPTNDSGYFMAGLNLTGSNQLWLGRAAIGWPVQFSGVSLSNNTWHHIAVSRAGSTNRCYVDGSLISTVTDSTSWVTNPSAVWIGGQTAGTSLNGFLDEFRWTVGSNRSYTGATITVPTAAYPEASPGTDPFFSSVSLLLHADGTGSTFVDSSPTPKTITANGATQSTAQSKFGGKSAAFNGSSSLAAPLAAFGTSDFVVEMWVYFTSIPGPYTGLFDARPGSQGTHPTLLLNGSSIALFTNSGFVISGGTIATGQWHHIALARSSGTTRLYLNGSQTGSSYTDANNYLSSASPIIGALFDGYGLNGYIDDLRVTVGSNRGYTGATYTVPTAAYPDA